jgi:hypothetical protein
MALSNPGSALAALALMLSRVRTVASEERKLCMLDTFSRHRRSDYGDAVYVGKNFGKIQFNQRVMNVSIHDVESGLAVLERVVKSSSRTFGNPKANIPGPIETVDFPTLQPLYVVVTTLVVGLSILWFVSRVFERNRKTKKSASSSTK